MKVEASESFFESLERLAWYDTKLWKVWEFIKRTIPRFFKNIWRFRKELAQHEWWDYRYTLEILYRSLTILEKGLSKDGMEVPESRNKKVEKIRRVLELLKSKLDNSFINLIFDIKKPHCLSQQGYCICLAFIHNAGDLPRYCHTRP